MCYAPFAPPKIVTTPTYETAQIVRFELANLDSYHWFKTIEINRATKMVLLKEHRNNREYWAELVDENREINDRLNFRFTIRQSTQSDYLHLFSLLIDWSNNTTWRLSSSALEMKNGELTLRGSDAQAEYAYKE